MPHSLPPGPITVEPGPVLVEPGPITVERPRAPRPDPLPEIPRQPDGVNGSPDSSSQEGCPLREFGCVAAQRRPSWRLLSSHTTSDGVVEYCKCTCEAVVVLSRGELAAFTAPPGD